MMTLVRSDYRINFTDDSLSRAREELAASENLRRQHVAEMDADWAVIRSRWAEFPPEVRDALFRVQVGSLIISRGDYDFGRTQMYEYIASRIPVLLPYIILRLFKDLKLRLSREKIQWAMDWAVFQILQKGMGDGKQRKSLASEYGMDKSFWTRASANRVAKSFLQIHKHIRNNAHPLDEHTTDSIEESAEQPEGVVCERLPRIESAEAKSTAWYQERREDWHLAERIADAAGIEKAVAYLEKCGFSKKSIDKFRSRGKP